MSKSFFLSKTKEQASAQHVDIYVDDDVLSNLYTKLDLARINFPILWKITKDFYGDITIKPNKLPDLKREIESFFTQTRDNTIDQNTTAFLKSLKILCDQGVKKQLKICVIAD